MLRSSDIKVSFSSQMEIPEQTINQKCFLEWRKNKGTWMLMSKFEEFKNLNVLPIIVSIPTLDLIGEKKIIAMACLDVFLNAFLEFTHSEDFSGWILVMKHFFRMQHQF